MPWELVLAVIIAVTVIIAIMMIRRKAPHKVIKEKDQPPRVIQIKSTSYYIPKDVDDCHKQLVKLLTQEQLKQVTESKEALDDLERWILERWLEVKIHSNEFREDKMGTRPNPLANFFRKMLIFNPNNMSHIITESFLAHMRGEDTKIDELVQKAWKESRDSFVKGLIELRGFESVKDIIKGPFLQTGDAVIFIDKIPRIFGREDLKEVIIHITLFHKLTFPIASEDDLMYIARHARGHFTIDYDLINRIFTIKDDVSTNGTLLNGMQIKGKVPQHLKNGDTISPAGKIPMKYVQI